MYRVYQHCRSRTVAKRETQEGMKQNGPKREEAKRRISIEPMAGKQVNACNVHSPATR